MMSSAATCSAPGKVLLAGGYLILDRPHAGTVLALDARFYTTCELVAITPSPRMIVEVHSPQFGDVRSYAFTNGALELLPDRDGRTPKANRYVEVPLLYALVLYRQHFEAALRPESSKTDDADASMSVGLRITLGADNGFYSQSAELHARGWPLNAASLRALPPMLPPRADESGDLAKTGLGSSATLVTSLLGALLHLVGVIELPARDAAEAPCTVVDSRAVATLRGEPALRLLHSLSQLCHCTAQGKVGSGFDVCSAVYGSQRYMRFSPSIIAPLLSLPTGVAPSLDALTECVVDHTWDHHVQPFQLPPGVEVLMADVSCGANTPSMVKKVLAWRKEAAGASALWERYATASNALQAALNDLCVMHRDGKSMGTDDEGWLAELARCGAAGATEWQTMGKMGLALSEVRSRCLAVRALLRAISVEAQTPIEPPEQTALLDATLAMRGVLMAVVPGAGGNDAVLALVIPSSEAVGGGGHSCPADGTRAQVSQMWRAWPTCAPPPAPSLVCELPVVESRAPAATHNGVLLEGAAAEATMRAVRRAFQRRRFIATVTRHLKSPHLVVPVLGLLSYVALKLFRR